MNKITLTRGIYELYLELERLEEVLDFSVFYSLSRAFESHNFLPGFHLDGEYYEIHENSAGELILMQFSSNSLLGDLGHSVSDSEVLEIVERLKEL
jgi:hypothetical protein